MTHFTEPNDLTEFEKALLTQIHIEACVRLLLDDALKQDPKMDIALFVFTKKHEIEKKFASSPTHVPIDPYWLARIRGK
jgi:hypothetical protein